MLEINLFTPSEVKKLFPLILMIRSLLKEYFLKQMILVLKNLSLHPSLQLLLI